MNCFLKVCGIKGIPILALHQPFDLMLGMVIDILHSIGVGVVKALLSSWFSPTKKHEPFSIHSKVVSVGYLL